MQVLFMHLRKEKNRKISKIFDIKGCFGSQGNYLGWFRKISKKRFNGRRDPYPPKSSLMLVNNLLFTAFI